MGITRAAHYLNFLNSMLSPPPGTQVRIFEFSEDSFGKTSPTLDDREVKAFFKERALREDAPKEPCAICFEAFDTAKAAALECNHVFHEECLKKWLQQEKRKRDCPMCRE